MAIIAGVSNPGAVQHLRTLLRIAAGPLAFVGYFLPWAHGPGILGATRFTGFTLTGYAGRLQALELPLVASGGLLFVRLLILGVAIAALWLAILAPRHRWHAAYVVSGWYLVLSAGVALVIGLIAAGLTLPQAGLALWFAGAACFLLAEYAIRGSE